MSYHSNYLPDFPNATWESGTIYYIMSAETGRMKIGYTQGDPGKRLKALQTGSPTKLGIVAIHPGTPETERKLHEKFAGDRMHGEWFDVSDDLMIHCLEVYDLIIALAKHGGREPPEWATSGYAALRSCIETLIAESQAGEALEGQTIQ